MTTDITIVRPENVQLIAQNAPKIFQDNSQRAQRCEEFGQQLTASARAKGMTDEMDMQLASYLDKTRKTIKLMNEQRAPITKLFDQIRAEFTAMENSIDPAKPGSVANSIQLMRNEYAAQKRRLEEQRRRNEMLRQQKTIALNKYEQDVEEGYRMQFNALVSMHVNMLTQKNSSITLENYSEASEFLANYDAALPEDVFATFKLEATHGPLVTDDEAEQIHANAMARLLPKFKEQFGWEVADLKATFVDALPAKRQELERIAASNAEEQARMKAELAAKEAAEAARLEVERKRKADEEAGAKKMQALTQEMTDAFNTSSINTPIYSPKTSVKKKVVALDAEGIMNIVSFWWSKDGQYAELDELTKMFKKQITAVEKYANDKSNPELIHSTHVRYEEVVKAK